MTDDGFMTLEEFKQLYPGLERKELVVLQSHDGDSTWQRRGDGWWRLPDRPVVPGVHRA